MNPLLAKYFIYYPIQFIRGENIHRYIKEYERSQWTPADSIPVYQFNRMKYILSYSFSNVPYYRNSLKQYGLHPQDIKSIDDWTLLPMLSKGNLQNDFTSLKSDDNFINIQRKTTGGSTGEPVTLLKTSDALARARAAMYRGYRWFNIDIGDRQARFWGVPLQSKEKNRYKKIDLLMNRVRFSAFQFKEADLARYLHCLIDFKPSYLYGYVSMLTQFAKYLESINYDGINLGVRHIVTTSEILQDWQRDLLSATFGCTIQNEYGCGEVGPIAYECPEGQMHLCSENLYVELIPNHEYPAFFDIVITELHNLAMPLIRYKIADLSSEKGAIECPCRRGLPIIGSIVGRAYDFIELIDGTKYHGEQIMYMFENLKKEGVSISQFQVIQKAISVFEIRLVADSRNSYKIELKLKRLFKKYFGEMEVEVNFVSEILRERSGKIRVVKNLLNSSDSF